jgi:P27 family predicted phage terminase small subunit
MGLRGPRPTPTHLKLIRGNPGQRALNKREPMPALPARPPKPPSFLTGYAREEWDRIVVEAFHLKLVTALDLNPLAAYCDAYERWRTAKETIAAMGERDPVTHGFIVKTQSGGAAPNPFVLIAQNAARDMVRFASEFGLTPAARSRISAIEAVGTGKFEGLIGGG